MRALFYLATAALLLSSCKKDDEDDKPAPADCANRDIAWITVQNESDNPYKFYIDGVEKATLNGHTSSGSIELAAGNNRHLKAIQQSGYIIYPTIREDDLNVVECSNYTWSFP